MHDARPTHIRTRACMGQVLFLLAVTLVWPWSPSADQAQYFYDELGRLSAVIDGTGAAAYYQYDAVGNLLAVVRGSSTDPPTITSVTPGSIQEQTTGIVTIVGTNLLGAMVTTVHPDLRLTVLPGTTETTVTVEVTALPSLATLGATSLTVTTPFGAASAPFTVLGVATTVIGTVVDDGGTPINGAQVELVGGFSSSTAADGSFQVTDISALRFPSMFVTATTVVAGEELFGASATVASVPNGVTDVGVVTVTQPQFDHEFGQPLSFDPYLATFVPFAQGFSFPFYGKTYTGVYVSPFGRLTFGFPDVNSEVSEEEFAEQAGIAPFWMRGFAVENEQVFVKQFPDRLVLTWFPEPDRNVPIFQATLFLGGRIVLAYGEFFSNGLVGITPGHSLGEVDFQTDTPLSTVGPVAIYQHNGLEVSGQLLTFTPNASEGFDVELTPRPEEFTTVVGRVVDENGTPLSGAVVSIVEGPSSVTASDGTFAFADVSIYTPWVLRVAASATVAGQPLAAISLPTRALANATTDVGTLTLAPYFFEPDVGERVNLNDDDRELVRFSNFTFPFYSSFSNPRNYSEVWITSNGRVSLLRPDILTDQTLGEFTAHPQIAPFFDNLNPSGTGEVYFHQFPNRFVVTWSQVPEFAAVGSNTFQATLFRDGRILFAYAGMTADDAIVGLSLDNTLPLTESDLSGDVPFSTTGATTIYEEFTGPVSAGGEPVGTDPFDLDHAMLLFVPSASGGYDVSQMPFVEPTTTVVGTVVDASNNPVAGMPVNTKTGQSTLTATDGTFTLASVPTTAGAIQVSAADLSGVSPLYGVSAAVSPMPMGVTDVGTFSVAGEQVISELGKSLKQGDDDFDLVPLTHGWTFPFYGTSYSQFYVNSNGRITFLTGDMAEAETVAELDEQPQIAPFFDDLEPEDEFAHEVAEEAIFVNQFPHFVVVTWPRVREVIQRGTFKFGTGANTFQATLFADGRILFSYQGMIADDAIVGISPGNSPTLTESNFSTQAPLSTASPVAIYEEFRGPLPDDEDEPLGNDPFDLDHKFITFTPNANGGFDVAVTPPSIESGTTTVVGTVVDEVGTPVSGAQVQAAGGPTGTTASDGTFTLTAVPFTTLTSMQVATNIMQNGQQVTGLSAPVLAVPSGITDVGSIILGRQYRALGAISFPEQAAFVDITTRSVVLDVIQTGRPQDVAATSDASWGLVINSRTGSNNQQSFYDLTVDPPVLVGSLPTPTLGNPSGAVITPDNRFAVLSGGQSDENLVVLDLAQRTVASEVLNLPGNQAAAVTPDGSMILVLSYSFPRTLSVVSLDSDGIATDTGQRVTIPGFDRGQIHITPNGKRALINSPELGVVILAIENGVVSYVDTITDIGLGDFGVTDLAITPDGRKVYVSNSEDSVLHVLAIDEQDVVTKTGTTIVVPAGLFWYNFFPANGMDFTFDGRTLMIVGSARNVLSFIDTQTDTVLPEVILYPRESNTTGIETYEISF